MKLLIILPISITIGSIAIADDTVTSTERQNDILGAHSLTLPAPVKRWDNAIPLGNGLTGGLLWGEGSKLKLSLDRGDLWDERAPADALSPERTFATLLKSVREKDRATFNKYFNATYDGGKWNKIPGGRLEMELPEGKHAKSFHLDFEKATGEVTFEDGTRAQAFFAATEPVAMLKLPADTRFKLIRPSSIDKLGYEPAQFHQEENEVSYQQVAARGFNYAFSVQWKELEDETFVVIATATNGDGEDPLARARKAAKTALEQGWEEPYRKHLEWWKELYNCSTVTIPRPRLQNHYNLVKYYHGASSRAHASPMPLQGVWTEDSNNLPRWHGDYHNDLNTQMTYVAFQAAGLTDPGMSYINYYQNRLPQFRKYGREFFGTEGAMVPGVMTHAGQAMGGWPQYAMSLTAGLWNGHAFYQHWKTTLDQAFLKDNAYPWLNEVASSVFSLCEEKDGKLLLPLSASPEWNNDAWSAYLTPNSNFDQALLIWASEALIEMATALNKPDDVGKWRHIRGKLAPLKTSPESSTLQISDGIDFEHSHRHFSHTLAIHPLGVINIEQSPEAKKTVRASVRQLIDNGSGAWVGYSFTWAASLAARAGFPEDAARLLTDFERAFVTRNGFHVNGDQTKSGLSGFQYRPFTLEGNFIFMDAIHEMYLQSWGGKIRVFPCVPASWKDASFTDLRAEGGFKISAIRKNGKTGRVAITSLHGGPVNLRNPFDTETFQRNIPVQIELGLIKANLKAGQSLVLSAGPTSDQ